jgi:hypothetical protein
MAGTNGRYRTNVEARIELIERLDDWASQLDDDVVDRVVDLLDEDPGRPLMTAIEQALDEADAR